MSFERIIMKRILSVVLIIAFVFSLSACGQEAYMVITAPGTYELQVFNAENKQEKGERPVTDYLKLVTAGVADGIEYVSEDDSFGCKKVGAYLEVFNPWIFPATYKDAVVEVTFAVIYRVKLAPRVFRQFVSDDVTVTMNLDETGFARAKVLIDPDPLTLSYPYFNNLVYYTGDRGGLGKIDISVAARISKASGTVTFYEKVDPTTKPVFTLDPNATPTATPEATPAA